MRVLLVSPYGTKVNPYLGLLREGLAAAGATVSDTRLLAPESLTGPDRPDVIHLHWIEGYDPPPPLRPRAGGAAAQVERGALRLAATGPLADLRRWLRLRNALGLLAGFQKAGGRVAYTAHNLDPHDSGSWPQRRALRSIIRSADLVHAHDAATAAELANRFGRREGVTVIPHGHYLPAYPNAMPREEARRRLGLPTDAFVYVCLGLLRPYKGLEELLPAFRSLAGRNARLIAAGKAADPRYAERLAALAGDDERIRLEPRFIPGDELQVYFNAADTAALPYRQITTSGAAMLAFSFGVPVLAPAIGAFPELVAPERGVLYAPGGLSTALGEAQARDWQAARKPIVDWVRQFDWTDIGRALLRSY